MFLKKTYFLCSLIALLCIGRVTGRTSLLMSAVDILLEAVKYIVPSNNILFKKIVNSIPYMLKKYEKLTDSGKRSSLTKLVSEVTDLVFYAREKLNIDGEGKIIFYLYNPKHQQREAISLHEIPKLKGKIFFVIHGWAEDITDSNWYEGVTNSILKKYADSHVVQVDWGFYSNAMIYTLAVLRTDAVARLLTRVIQKLVIDEGLPLKNVVLIGFSLGGQISGLVGKQFFKMTNMKLPLIIALDPAGPFFEGLPSDYILHGTDADTVMVVHTDTTFCGFGAPCGTIDFYPNDGHDQPGCDHSSNLFCSHTRSHDLFALALISSENFPARRCNSYQDFLDEKCDDKVFFGNIETKNRGVYFLNTTSEDPFYNTFQYAQNTNKFRTRTFQKFRSSWI